MPHLKYHPAGSEGDTPLYTFPAPVTPPRVDPKSEPDLHLCGDSIYHVERALAQAEQRLANLRDLAERFGLSDDDGPRAA